MCHSEINSPLNPKPLALFRNQADGRVAINFARGVTTYFSKTTNLSCDCIAVKYTVYTDYILYSRHCIVINLLHLSASNSEIYVLQPKITRLYIVHPFSEPACCPGRQTMILHVFPPSVTCHVIVSRGPDPDSQ